MLYSKAARAELDKNYDLAMSLYVQSGQTFLDLSKRATGEQMRSECRKGAVKSAERAERIRDVKKDLKPIVTNPFQECTLQQVVLGQNYSLKGSITAE